MFLVMWMACGEDEDPDDTAAPADPVQEALGGCTATTEGTRDNAAYTTTALVWNGDGDTTSREVTYAASGNAYLTTWEWEAPHEESSMTYDAPDDADDLVASYVWVDGRVTELRWDYGADGVVDEIEIRGYTAEGLWASNDWDYDADGVSDDHIGYAWETEEGGWHGTGDGLDPYGTYTTEVWADPTARVYHYRYDDDRGVSAEWEVSAELNALGYVAHNTDDLVVPGEYESHVVEDRTFDDLGRFATNLYSFELTEDGAATTTTVTNYTWTYACP